jgi:hypothetical protein
MLKTLPYLPIVGEVNRVCKKLLILFKMKKLVFEKFRDSVVGSRDMQRFIVGGYGSCTITIGATGPNPYTTTGSCPNSAQSCFSSCMSYCGTVVKVSGMSCGCSC